ncbi:uncharacterized protein K02A2.6-like [Cydia pomonella]|uniref:uncharacterized protein K02A2.6-like n=1 Tax=Cydia pomonella TaxID=82600 RepID=UPI002ADE194C|nr:uncharacterized protein K02A2.6-like [Cydia pomonella]
MSTREEDVHAVRVGGGGGARAPPRRRQPAAAPRARCPRCLGTHHPRSCSFMNTECYLAREFPQVFAQGTGKFTGKPIQLKVASDARPVFCKPRAVPHALRAAVEAELERLQADGVISPVETSE